MIMIIMFDFVNVHLYSIYMRRCPRTAKAGEVLRR